jgi:type IV secretion system protein VirD4
MSDATNPDADRSYWRRFADACRSISFRSIVLFGLWLTYVSWTGWLSFKGLFAIGLVVSGSRGLAAFPFQILSFVAFNLWACAAGLLFGLILVNPFSWLNGKRLIYGSIALGMILGRVATYGTLGWFLKYVYDVLPVPAYFAVAPFALALTGLSVIMLLGLLALFLFTCFVAIPAMLFNQILVFENAVHVYRHQARGLAGYIIRAVYWLRSEERPAAPPDESKGARFATMPEISRVHKPNAPQSMAFGHIGNALKLKTDKHVLIMASTRSGKGVTLIIPHLLRYQGSAFVLDPKGENARATGRQRARLNHKVHYLDPFGISGLPRSRFNPLSRFTPDNMEAESKALAAALFVVGDRERDHWTASGQQLLAAIILYVYVSKDIPDNQRDLPTVRKVLLGGLKPALNAMTEIDEADGLLRDLAVSFLETPEKEFGSIVSTAQRQTEILDNPYMIDCLSATGGGEEVDFSMWHDGTMTVYLCLAAPKFPVFNRWLRLVLTSALDEMTNTLDPPELPVCFMLDELATLGHLSTIENAVGLAAGYGIQLVSVFQDIAQMRDLYKGRWASFIGNAGVRALFNLDDFETAEYWSKFIGGTLVETRSRQQDLYGLSQGDNVGEAMRPLLPPDKLMMNFASGKMLVLAQGSHPIVTDRVAYWNDKSLDGAWDDPRMPPRPPASVHPVSLVPQKPVPSAAAQSDIRVNSAPPSPRSENVQQAYRMTYSGSPSQPNGHGRP